MARKKKIKPIIEGVELTSFGAQGKALTRINDKVLFVPFGAPGDKCDVQVLRNKSSFREGRIVKLIEASADRTEPNCNYFGTCGGCQWQHLQYDKQLAGKEQQVRDTLERVGHLTVEEFEPILGCSVSNQYRYRNKVEFTFSDNRWVTAEELAQVHDDEHIDDRNGLGFFMPKRFDRILDLNTCFLATDIADEIRNWIKQYALDRVDDYPFFNLRDKTGFMRTLMIRNTREGDLMVLIAFAKDEKAKIHQLLDDLLAQFPAITSLFYVVNTKLNDSFQGLEPVLYHGEPTICERMHGLKYIIGPLSFYQTNSEQAETLYAKVKEYTQLTGQETVYDLYTGAGTIANYVADQAREVIGIEYVEEAVQDAYKNRDLNQIENTSFYAGDMKDILTDQFIAEHGEPDVLITDPPRAGMHPDVVQVILRAAPKRIVYVSCNPASQARDLEMIVESGQYKIVKSCAVDMFPHTHHVENVVLIDRISCEID